MVNATQQRAKPDWAVLVESGQARAAYYQRLADHHRASAADALRNLEREGYGG